MNVKFPFMFVPAEADVVGKAAGFVAQGSDEAVGPHFGVGFTFHFLRLASELQRAIGDDMNLRTVDVHEFSILDWARVKMVVALEKFVLK